MKIAPSEPNRIKLRWIIF